MCVQLIYALTFMYVPADRFFCLVTPEAIGPNPFRRETRIIPVRKKVKQPGSSAIIRALLLASFSYVILHDSGFEIL